MKAARDRNPPPLSEVGGLSSESQLPRAHHSKAKKSNQEAPTAVGLGNLTPVKPKQGGVSLPAGPWGTTLQSLEAPLKEPLMEGLRQSLQAILASPLPGRAVMVKAAIEKRSESPHALYRAVADWRTAQILEQLKGRTYAGRSGFVLNSEDGHMYQPNTVRHSGAERVMSIGDSDRIGFAPYDLEVRSWLASIELEGRGHEFSPSDRLKAMRAFLDAYVDGIHSVAKADDPEERAKELRITSEHAPKIMEPYLEAASDSSHQGWLKKVLETGPIRFKSNPTKLVPLPDDAAGHQLKKAIEGALPQYLAQLDPDDAKQLKALNIADLAMPVKGNGSLGYGRYQVVLAPADGDRSKAVVLELKEQIATPTDRAKEPIDQSSTFMFGEDQGTRAVSLFRLGTGQHAARDWGSVELPGAGVLSSHFTVKEIHGDEQGMDLSHLKKGDFIEMAAAQGRIVASFQALGGINGAAAKVGGAADIWADLKSRKGFAAESIAGAGLLADQTATLFEKHQATFGPIAAALS